jgi:hypothetical protein
MSDSELVSEMLTSVNSVSTLKRVKSQRLVMDTLRSPEFHDAYTRTSEFASVSEPTSTSRTDYSKDPVFMSLAVPEMNYAVDPVVDLITEPMIKTAFLYTCSRGLIPDMDVMDYSTPEFRRLAFDRAVESQSEELVAAFVRVGILDELSSEETEAVLRRACEDGFVFPELVRLAKTELDSVFEFVDDNETEGVMRIFLSRISQETRNHRLLKSHSNTSLIRLLIEYGVDYDVFAEVFSLVCRCLPLVGSIRKDERHRVRSVVDYAYAQDSDPVVVLLSSNMMTVELLNSELSLMSELVYCLPTFVLHPLTSKAIIGSKMTPALTDFMDEEIKPVTVVRPDRSLLGPDPGTNYIDGTRTVIIGGMPNEDRVRKLVNSGVTVFVDLTGQGVYSLPSNIEYIALPVGVGIAPSKAVLASILAIVDSGRTMYIHCSTGSGRSCTVAAAIVGLRNNLNAKEAVDLVVRARGSRTQDPVSFIPVPETPSQVKFLLKILGPSVNDSCLDRSDKTWERHLKKMNLTR